ncbi:hypothetical protein CSPX01_16623 [Colletotrichum filicis]|nr:hypothetical protein CSPX01_16623 [Colletotrichum filicis]
MIPLDHTHTYTRIELTRISTLSFYQVQICGVVVVLASHPEFLFPLRLYEEHQPSPKK